MDVLAGAMQGMGRSLLPMLVALGGVCVFRVIWVFTVFSRHTTLFMLILSYPVSWILTFTVHGVCLLFIRKKVAAELAGVGPQADGIAQSEEAVEPQADGIAQSEKAVESMPQMDSATEEQTLDKNPIKENTPTGETKVEEHV